ncbi:NAD+ synthase [Candidatus Micrarchaeota archaeon]|nr:NAD+ synthase [Candidatus Micrarchaeota archaeon]
MVEKSGFGEFLYANLELKFKLVQGIQTYFKKARKTKAVLGLSGGVDSAVVCALLVQSLGKENVLAYFLPSDAYASEESDARNVANQFGVSFETHSIQGIADHYAQTVQSSDPIARGNFMARSRMTLLYHFARETDALVVGTSNKSERLMGYFTKFGDGAADVLPVGALYKTQVKKLALMLAIPKEIIRKAPSAGLWEGQTDEAELGVSYSALDHILVSYLDMKQSRSALDEKYGHELVENVLTRMGQNQHKRVPATIISID